MLKRPQAVIFDLDGTLIDSRVPFVTSMNYALVKMGQDELEPEQLYPYLGPPTFTTFGELVGGGDERVNEAVAVYREHYSRTAAQTTQVYDGVPEMLNHLGASVPLAVATSKAVNLAVPLLRQLGLSDHFRVVSGSLPQAPDETKTQTLRRALGELGNPARAVMVGDRFYDIVGARENELPSIGVLWGAGSREELEQAGADALAERPADICAITGL